MTWLWRVTVATFLLLPIHAFSPFVPTLHESPTAALPGADEVATITGSVTSDVDGAPLWNVSIILIDPDNHDWQSSVALTDSEGYYTVTQTISHTWIIRFDPISAQAFHPFLPEYYNNTYDLESATPILAEAGTTTPNISASLANHGQVSGRVTAAADGKPIAGVRVTTYEPPTGYELSNVVTDSSGAYTFTNYSPGTYKLRFIPPAFSGYALEYYNNKTSLGKGQTITVQEGRDLRVDVSLVPGGMITGMVTSNWFDKLIEYPTVLLLNENGEQIQSGNRFTSVPYNEVPVDPPGYYTIYNVPEGSYELNFTAENHRSFHYTTPVEVIAREKTTNINAKLARVTNVTAIATSTAAPGIILLTMENNTTPIMTLDGGMTWQPSPTTPWVVDETILEYPDRYTIQNFTAGVTPRGLPGEGTRLLINVGADNFYPNSLRPGLYRSGDNGQSWADSGIDPPLDQDTCTYVKFSKPVTTMRAPDRLYMFYTCPYDTNNLLISTNGGVNWRDVTTLDGRTLLLYTEAHIVPSPLVDGLLYINDGRLQWYKSANEGIDWQTVNFPLESLALDAQNANLLYGWSPVIGEPADRIGKRSTDGGATWQDWAENPCHYGNYYVDKMPQLLAHPTKSQTLFVLCDNDLTNGLYRSTNGGDSWSKIANTNGQLLAADLGSPGRILWAKEDGLWASTDSGDTWHPILQNYRVLSTPLFLPTVASGN